MRNNVFKVLLISKNAYLAESVENIVNEINMQLKFDIDFYVDSDYVDRINPQLILIDSEDTIELNEKINKIKSFCLFNNKTLFGIIKKETLEDLNPVVDLGVNDYIVKPWDISEAKVRIKNIIKIAYMNNFSYLENEQLNIEKLLIENIPFAMWIVKNNGNIYEVNDNFINFLSKKREELIGANLYEIIDNQEGRAEDFKIINSKTSLVLKKDIHYKGMDRSLEIYKSPIFNEDNEVVGVVGLMRDITDIRKAHNDIKRLVFTDYLTDLPNRQGLYNYVEANIANTDTYVSLLFIDLDDFKKLNDTYGSHFGDQVLLAIAENLKMKCKDNFVARVGGDEFVVIIKDFIDPQELKNEVNDICKSIKIELQDNLNTISVIPSIGVVSNYIKEVTLEKLLMQGDLALLKAKELGKNRIIFYTDELEAENNFSQNIEEDLKNAIRKNEIVLFYQPQFTCKKVLKGFESLFRWKNDKYSRVPVIDIIKIIESKGMIDEIGTYIIEQAAIFAKKANEMSSEKLTVSVNISAIQLMDDNFLAKFINVVEKVGIEPSYLSIELTETVLLQDMDKNIEKLNALREMGVIISLDDFGTGYSSLNYLVKLPISELKIDKSFVQSMDAKEEYITLIKLMSDIGHMLKLKVVAEGVEEEEQLQILDDLKVDYIQGYFFSKPLPEEDAIKYIR